MAMTSDASTRAAAAVMRTGRATEPARDLRTGPWPICRGGVAIRPALRRLRELALVLQVDAQPSSPGRRVRAFRALHDRQRRHHLSDAGSGRTRLSRRTRKLNLGGVEICNRGRYQPGEMSRLPAEYRTRPRRQVVINGVAHDAYDFRPEQYESLASLSRACCASSQDEAVIPSATASRSCKPWPIRSIFTASSDICMSTCRSRSGIQGRSTGSGWSGLCVGSSFPPSCGRFPRCRVRGRLAGCA